jgi:hypothetical protein
MDGDELTLVDSHKDSIVAIDPDPVVTTDFDLRPEEKELLLKGGRAAVLRFLYDRKIQDGRTLQDVLDAEAEVTEKRRELHSWCGQLSLRFRRWFTWASLLVLFLVLFAAIWKHALLVSVATHLWSFLVRWI